MKKIYLVFFLGIFCSSIFAGNISVSAGSVSANPGDSVSISIGVSGFSNVGAITIAVQYNSDVLSWGRVLNWNSQVSGAMAGGGGGSVTISYDNISGINISGGTLVELKFLYRGGTSQIDFPSSQCEITDLMGNPLEVTYYSGSVTQNPPNYQLTMNAAGEGNGLVKVNGQLFSFPYSGSFSANTLVSLEAVPGTGSNFTEWGSSLSGSSNPTTILMNGDKSVSAKFNLNSYNLIINKGTGSGSVKVNGTVNTLPYSGWFSYGTSISIEAVPASGYFFTSWSGSVTGTSNPLSISLESNKEITANFDQQKMLLNINKSGNGSGQIKVNDTIKTIPFSGSFKLGSSVKVEAVPDKGSYFDKWSGDLTGNSNPFTITMNGNKTISTEFKLNVYKLDIYATGKGKVKVNGTEQTLPFMGGYYFGTNITIEAIPDTGYSFSNWSGNLTDSVNPISFIFDGHKDVYANFEPRQMLLNIDKSGNGSGQIKVNDTLRAIPFNTGIKFGSSVKLEAVPDDGSSFIGWSGDLTGSTNPASLTVGGNKVVKAGFYLKTYQLSITKSGDGSGKIKINDTLQVLPFSRNYLYGTSVKLEAVPEPGNAFTKWSSVDIQYINPALIAVNGNMNLTVEFTTKLPEIPGLVQPGNNCKGICPEVLFAWNNIPNATAFQLQVSTDSSFSKNVIADTVVHFDHVQLTGLEYKTKYYWHVRGINSKGYGTFSEKRCFSTGVKKINKPNSLTANSYAGIVELRWLDNSDNELSFALFRKEGDSLSVSGYELIGAVSMNATYYKDQNIQTGKMYSYQVCGFNVDTVSAYSNQAQVTVITKVDETLGPKDFQLFQNFPNPFNPITKIKYCLPKGAFVSLKVCDVLGKEIVTLVNEEKSTGTYEVEFNGSNYPSGVYLYRIQAGNFTDIKKLILMK